ncbi:hypothetical protein UUU_32680 [Klebsiella pneumoniae subsp. pneumoniae DSM 30104 = JCM 1662 = NBRC 14940]|nr:hypothetical protein UUU_32680 [Klebsiella pneumoniae subsp. pneumoniae DSM 30104 = JCM 1662 = NBRC 14940]
MVKPAFSRTRATSSGLKYILIPRYLLPHIDLTLFIKDSAFGKFQKPQQ